MILLIVLFVTPSDWTSIFMCSTQTFQLPFKFPDRYIFTGHSSRQKCTQSAFLSSSCRVPSSRREAQQKPPIPHSDVFRLKLFFSMPKVTITRLVSRGFRSRSRTPSPDSDRRHPRFNRAHRSSWVLFYLHFFFTDTRTDVA